MKRVRSRSEKISLALSIAFHSVIVLLLILSFEKTIHISAPPSKPSEQKPIIDAVMVSKKSLQEEVQRLEQKEAKKRQDEENRIKAIAQKEKEAQQKREKEEALAIELKKKNEELKKQAELKKIAEEKREKEVQAKLKQEQEELKKIQKQKEVALKKSELEKKVAEQKAKELADQKNKELAEKQAKEAEQKANEQANAPAVNPRVLQNEITRYALMMRNKIHQYWRQPIGFDYDGLTCKVLVTLLPTGEVVGVKIITSSGSIEFDRSTELAIKKASPLPMPEDTNIAKEFREFTFTFHPEAA